MKTMKVGDPGWESAGVFDLDEGHYLPMVVQADEQTGNCIEYIMGPDGRVQIDSNGELMAVLIKRNILIQALGNR